MGDPSDKAEASDKESDSPDLSFSPSSDDENMDSNQSEKPLHQTNSDHPEPTQNSKFEASATQNPARKKRTRKTEKMSGSHKKSRKMGENSVSLLQKPEEIPAPSIHPEAGETEVKIPKRSNSARALISSIGGYPEPTGEPVVCACEELGKNLRAEIVVEEKHAVYIHFLGQDKRLDRWVARSSLLPLSAETPAEELPRHSTFTSHRMDHPNTTPEVLKFEESHRRVTRVRNINEVTVGANTFRTWYFAPYPYPFYNCNHLYICDKCAGYFGSQAALEEHWRTKNEVIPPGNEIYRKGNISIFQMHGQRQKVACQNLCLLAKLFLDHKTLCYDVEGFVFYLLCETDESGAHIAAYCSRELGSEEHNVLACIVCLPPYQKRGYGRLLIELTQEIAKRQRRPGGPERPLSDLGKIAYYSYWRDKIVETLRDHRTEVETLTDVVRLTGIDAKDVADTMKELGCAKVDRRTREYMLKIDEERLKMAIERLEKGRPREHIDPELLIWLKGDDDSI